jgi:hypothetical protein
MPVTVARVSAALLALTFTWAAVAKLMAFGRWRDALRSYRLPPPLHAIAEAGVPGLELAVAALLVTSSAKAGSALALAMIATFSLAVLRARAQGGDRLPCGCFGRASPRDYRALLARNAALGLLTAIVLTSDLRGAVADGLGARSWPDALPAALVVAGVVLAAWTARRAADALRGGSYR